MKLKATWLLVVAVGTPVGVLAQPAPEPPLLMLPMGARVRVQTTSAPGSWVKGFLASADSETMDIVPEGAPPFGANQLRVPSASVSRFEMATGKKRHWLVGLVAGAAVGILVGATTQVDPVACEYNYDYECSRGAAFATYGIGFSVLGVAIGSLVKTDQWTPVALDALARPAPRVSGAAPRIRALPRGGVEVGVAIGF